MASLIVGPGQAYAPNTDGTGAVPLPDFETLNIAGAPDNPAEVALSQAGDIGLLKQINIANANVTLDAAAGISAVLLFGIGSGGRLEVSNTAKLAAGTSFAFLAPNSRLALNDAGLSLLSEISGLSPGSSIEVSAPATGLAYADAPGADTGGVLSLLDSNGNPAGMLHLSTGDFSDASFELTPDGKGGVLVSVETVVTAVTVSPAAGSPGAQTVVVGLATSGAATVAGGLPTLALNNGGVAVFDPVLSTPTSLAFGYAPPPGQDPSGLAISAVSLNGATVADSAGNAVSLAGAIGASPFTPAPNFRILSKAASTGFDIPGDSYNGPVASIQHQYVTTTADDINVTALTPNVFIHSGSGNDAIDVSGSSGTNVLDGSTGSNFLVGGTGTDTFFIDNRAASASIWSTVSNFHAGDAVTIYGVTAADFMLGWEDNQGAAGYTGLTLHATAAGKPVASMTIAGYNTSDLGNGRLTVLFGADPASQSDYMFVRGN